MCCEGGLLPAQSTAPKAVSSQVSALATGPYYALVIGNNNYQHLHKLQTAVNDAKAIAELLRDRYGFQTKLLLDADRQHILNALVDYRKELPANSNLIIYYAGHGHHDRDTDESYWLPIDAQDDTNANWISADDITRDIRAISSNHVLVISDSCYSGYLTREGESVIDRPKDRSAFLARKLNSKSRTLISSGGDEPVVDGGAPGHSVFAFVFLQSLNRIDLDSFTAQELYDYMAPAVAGKSDQLPQYSVIRNSGHMYGDFVFSRPHASVSPAPAPAKTASATTTNAIAPRGNVADKPVAPPTLTAANNPAAPPNTRGTTAPSPSTSLPTSGPSVKAPERAPEKIFTPSGRSVHAKSAEEMRDYQAALAITDPDQMEAAADRFATQYPQSELRGPLFVNAMNLFSRVYKSAKVISVGRKAIAADPINPVALVEVASALRDAPSKNSAERLQQLSESADDARAAISNIDTGLFVPLNSDPEQANAAKRGILSVAYATLGRIDMERNDFGSAESKLLQAIDLSKRTPNAALYLSLSVTQEKLGKLSEALTSANAAYNYSADGTPARKLATQQVEGLKSILASRTKK